MFEGLIVSILPVIVPSIPGDPYEEGSATLAPSAYQAIPYEIILTFNLLINDGGEEPSPASINSMVVNITGISGIVATVVDNDPFSYKIKLSGAPTGTNLTNGSYSLVLQASGITDFFPTITVPATNDLPDYLALYSWILPIADFVFVENAYTFIANGAYEYKLSHYVFLDWNNAVFSFKQVVNNGEI